MSLTTHILNSASRLPYELPPLYFWFHEFTNSFSFRNPLEKIKLLKNFNTTIRFRLLIGVTLSVVGNLLISVAMNVQKYSHNQLIHSNKSYIRSFTWWIGLLLMILGEVSHGHLVSRVSRTGFPDKFCLFTISR